MNRQIPYVFDDVEFYQDLVPTSFSNICRTRVRAFYKYGNRNGAYITDEVAEMLIQTAPARPIVGFYNHETSDFEGHTVSELARGYGFISENPNFAWEEHYDCDGKKRTYACFDAILHTGYWEEAGQIVGKAQSMELDKDFIDGEWTDIDNDVYFVYTKARMKGFCVLGKTKEPCFEGAAFVNEDTRFEKFSLLIANLIDKYRQGGNEEMGLENVISNEEPVVTAFEESVEDGGAIISEPEVNYEALYNDLKVEYENLQNEVKTLNDSFEQAKSEHETAKADFEKEIADLKEQVIAKEAIIGEYQKADNAIKTQQKEELIKSYEKLLDAEDIASVKEQIDSFTYEEIESSLAVKFSKKSMAEFESNHIHCPEHVHSEEDEFALFMKNYKR